MKTVLLLDTSGPHYFQRRSGQWRQIDNPSEKDSLWVLIDLPDETMDVIDMPRLVGRDRASFMERRLATAFGDSPYRAGLVLSGGTLGAGKVLLNGLAMAADIERALKRMNIPVAGVWGKAAIMAMMAKKLTSPNMVMAMPSSDELRIVVIKDHIPVLTRCLHIHGDNNADEIIVTYQYLQNLRLFDPSTPPPVLFLGELSSVEEPLVRAGYSLLPVPKQFNPKGDVGWLHPIIEKIVSSPPCQWAPTIVRAGYISRNIKLVSYCGTVVGLASAMAYVTMNLQTIVELEKSTQASNQNTQSVSLERDKLAEHVKGFNFEPNLARNVMQFQAREIEASLPASFFLQLASTGLKNVPEARLSKLSFSLSSSDENSLCSGSKKPDTGTANNSSGATADGSAAEVMRYAEVMMTVLWPNGYSTTAKIEARKQVSAALQSIPGVDLLLDPVFGTRYGRLTTGDAATGGMVEEERWCMQVPWQKSATEEKVSQ